MKDSLLDPARLFSMAGKSVLISGATGALGEAVTMALAQAGAKLTLADKDGEKLDALAASARAAGAVVATVDRWPTSEADAAAIVATAVQQHERLDAVLITNGTNAVADIVDIDLADWQRVMDANVQGPWLLCQAAGRQLIKQGHGGKVVILSSTRGKLGHPAGYTAYCTSKAAVDGLVRTLACEWGKYGITVNAVGPTVIRSPLTAWMFADEDPGKSTRESMLQRIPLGRLGEPADIVGGIYFLLSPASDFCTGQTLYVDGGYTAG
jgi:NAD(P)-dependent dehydrogenase (short-subunit alcohol dehydrogenase family)